MTNPQKLIQGGQLSIFKESNRLYLVNYHTNWIVIIQFIIVQIAVIVLINGIIQLLLEIGLGILLVVIAVGLGILPWLLQRHKLNVWQRPITSFYTTLIIDFDHRTLLDNQGKLLSPLDNVNFSYGLHIPRQSLYGYQTKTIALTWDNQFRIIAGGNIFTGHNVKDTKTILEEHGLVIKIK